MDLSKQYYKSGQNSFFPKEKKGKMPKFNRKKKLRTDSGQYTGWDLKEEKRCRHFCRRWKIRN